MSRFLLSLAVLFVLFASACVKKGPTKACFTLSKESPKVNDTLYILNCSENYSKFIWYNVNGFFPGGATVDSLSRHQKIVVTAAGPYPIYLRVGEINGFFSNSTSGYNEVLKVINVNP